KDDERRAGARRIRKLIGVLGALLHIEALDELRAEAAEEYARDELVAQLALGDERAALPGQQREQHEPVQIARVVGGDDVGGMRRQVFQSAHDERNRAEAQEEPRAAAAEAPRGPAG